MTHFTEAVILKPCCYNSRQNNLLADFVCNNYSCKTFCVYPFGVGVHYDLRLIPDGPPHCCDPATAARFPQMWRCLACDLTPPYRPRISPGSTSVFGRGATVLEICDSAARVGFLQCESAVGRRLNNNRRHKATRGSTRRFSMHLNQHMMGLRANSCIFNLSDFLFSIIAATSPSLGFFGFFFATQKECWRETFTQLLEFLAEFCSQ